MSNSIMVIFPKRNYGIWSFTDKEKDLTNEPFVGDINLIISTLSKNIPRAEEGIAISFSENQFPDFDIELEHVRKDMSGNWYKVMDCKEQDLIGIEGWLCPALLKYFTEAPKHIYAKIGC